MLMIGIDDTDIVGSPGTNQLAREIVRRLPAGWTCTRIVRHQLFFDPGVPYTSKNGSASITLESKSEITDTDLQAVIELCRRTMREWFVEGSDPGLCVVAGMPDNEISAEIYDYALRCQQELIPQELPRALAARHGIHLEGLGGTEDGVIGALAAIGLAARGNDGRIIQLGEWSDDFSGPRALNEIQQRGIVVQLAETDQRIQAGRVQVGKRLRPNLRNNQPVLFVRQQNEDLDGCTYAALKLP